MPSRTWKFSEALSRGFVELLGRPPFPRELEAFSRYLWLLLQWNQAHRLTGYRTPAEITERLLLDSLLFRRWINRGDRKLLDLGAGAGIPGIPLKIIEPSLEITLLEGRRRQSSFLATVVRELGLEGIEVRWGRAEELLDREPVLRAVFDVVVTRAAGPLKSIVPLALAYLAPGGRLIASGPPAGKTFPTLPRSVPHRWESLPGRIGGTPRRFLVAEKVD